MMILTGIKYNLTQIFCNLTFFLFREFEKVPRWVWPMLALTCSIAIWALDY